MKKLAIMLCALTLMSTAAVKAEETTAAPAANTAEKTAPAVNEGIKTDVKQRPSKEEMMKIRKAREAAFEQKLGLTDEQKAKAKEIRLNGHKQMKPVMEQIFAKKKEAEMVKMSRIATWAQEEKLAAIDKEIQELQKQANSIRKQNMKDFESILTRDQKKILKQMKKEGRQRFEQRQKLCPPPCPEKVQPTAAPEEK